MGIHGTWLPAERRPDPRGLTSAERRGGRFSRYLPPRLASQDVAAQLDRDVREDALEVAAEISVVSAQIDDATREGIFPLLLRSESIASSMIERIAATPRDVSYAQLGDSTPHLGNHDALSVARNVRATRVAIEALAARDSWTVEDVELIHQALAVPGVRPALREVDVWIGGRTPVTADYVAPPADQVRPLIADLLRCIDTSGEHPLLLAAVAHAQFESIHPFEDGHRRVGRALVHAILERGRVVRSGLLPISTVIRRREREYVACLDGVRTDDPDGTVTGLNAWVRFFVEVARDATDQVRSVQEKVHALDLLLADKAEGLRSDSAARRLLPVLREQPVITAGFVADHLAVSRVAAHRAVDSLVDRGILVPGTGRYRRAQVFQAPAVLDLLDDALDGHP